MSRDACRDEAHGRALLPNRLRLKDLRTMSVANSSHPEPGARFYRLVVLSVEPPRGKRRYVMCRCDCGTEKTIRLDGLKSGAVKSCGCWKSERPRYVNGRLGVGATKWPEYRVWMAMKARCNKPSDPHYKNYGGRGIYICEEWCRDFHAFINHVGRRPGEQYTIERIDNDGPYAPGNVRWATRIEQQNNRRVCAYIEHEGSRLTLSQWARLLCVPRSMLEKRRRLGWSVAETLFLPSMSPRGRRNKGVLDMNGNRVPLLNLSMRKSKAGKVYYVGYLSKAKILGFPSSEPDKFGNEQIELFVVEPAPKRDQPAAEPERFKRGDADTLPGLEPTIPF